MAHNDASSEVIADALSRADPAYDDDEDDEEEEEEEELPSSQPMATSKEPMATHRRSPSPRRSSRHRRRSRSPSPLQRSLRSRSRSRQRHPLPFLWRHQPRTRQRSPPPSQHRRRTPSPLFFRRGRLVVVTFDRQLARLEADWKQVFRRQNFLIYDHKYPFRMAAETVLRQNKHYQQPSRYRDYPTGDLTERLHNETVRLFGQQFDTNYFVDWVENLSSSDRKQPIVVFGVDKTSSAQALRSNLRRMGGMVVGPPLSDSDYIVHTTRDLEKFVKDL